MDCNVAARCTSIWTDFVLHQWYVKRKARLCVHWLLAGRRPELFCRGCCYEGLFYENGFQGLLPGFPSDCVFYGVFFLKDAVIKAWDYHLDNSRWAYPRIIEKGLITQPSHKDLTWHCCISSKTLQHLWEGNDRSPLIMRRGRLI